MDVSAKQLFRVFFYICPLMECLQYPRSITALAASVSLFSCYLSLSYFPHSLLALSMAIPQHIINNSWIFSTVCPGDRWCSRGSVRWLVRPTAYRRIRLVSTALNKCFQQDNAVSAIGLLSYFNITSSLDIVHFPIFSNTGWFILRRTWINDYKSWNNLSMEKKSWLVHTSVYLEVIVLQKILKVGFPLTG